MINNQSGVKIKKLLIIIGVVLSLCFLIVILFLNLKGDKEKVENMVVLEEAPENLTYPLMGEANKKQYNGVEYYIDENGNVHIIKDGEDYIIYSNGDVYKEGEKVEGSESGSILNTIREISKENGLISSLMNKDDIDRKLLLSSLSNDEIDKLSKELGIDLRKLLEGNPNLTLEEALKLASNEKEKNTSEKENTLTLLDNFLKEMGITDMSAEELLDYIAKSGKTLDAFFQDVLNKGAREAFKGIGLSVATGEETPLIDLKKDNGFIKINDGTYIDPKSGKKYRDLGDGKFEEIRETDDIYKAILEGGRGDFDMSSFSDIASPDTYQRQNGQSKKLEFLKSRQNGTKVVSRHMTNSQIVKGTVINAILINGINTDLPGDVSALIRENVYDYFTNENILLPKGSRLIGSYDSNISWGQNRVQIVWTEVIRPDGVIIALNGYNGTDTSGMAGNGGNVNNHIVSMIASSGLSSLISIGNNYVNNISSSSTLNSILGTVAGGMSENAALVSGKLLEKVIDRQPTITIEPGTLITVLANDNVELPLYKKIRGETWR